MWLFAAAAGRHSAHVSRSPTAAGLAPHTVTVAGVESGGYVRDVIRVLALALVGLLAAAPVSASADARAGGGGPELDGRWRMTFTTTSNHGFTNPKVGSRRVRIWIFERRGRRLVARRETAEGFITLRLRRSGSVYRVEWRTRAPCRRGNGKFTYSETVTFTVSDTETVGGRELGSRVTGRLIGRSPKGDCGGDPGGRATDRLTGRRTDLPREPVAAFSVEPPMLSAASPVTATAYLFDESTDDGEVRSQQWDFGDPASGAANTATGPYAAHTYTAAGSYRVTLTVTDDVGLTDTAAAIVTVAP